jgi:2-polyprenyl-3-methyl-5-hydroxy-6-metoxy-1,4-benzoquinol methylase
MQNPYALHGAALMDYYRGDVGATLISHQDGQRDDVPAAFWFRENIDPIEDLAVDLCRGRILDVGAGTGVHSLKLQGRGQSVTSIDIVPECVAIMQERGVRNAMVADVCDFAGPAFDTILCICNGLDKVGRFSDLPRFLTRIRELLSPDGQLIADSFDLRIGADLAQRAEFARKEAAGRYFGELDMRFEYKSCIGEPFTVLQVDFETLRQVAEDNG